MTNYRSSMYVSGMRIFASASIAIATFMLLVGTATAGELDPKRVPADVKWLLHVDQEALSDMELVEELREMYPDAQGKIREWLKNRYGIDPEEGLQSITMFSADYRLHTGTVLLQTEYDEQKLISILDQNEGFKTTEWQGHRLYTVTLASHDATKHKHKASADQFAHESAERSSADTTSHGHDHTGGLQMTVFFGDEQILLASSVPNAKSVLRTLKGDAQSLADSNSPLVSDVPSGAVVYGAAIELGRLDRYEMLLPLLQHQERCRYTFGQYDDRLFEELTLTAQSEEAAEKTMKVVEGLVAYEKLYAADSESLSQLMQNVHVERDGTRTVARWHGETQVVIRAIEDLSDRLKSWMQLVSH